jgi:putative transposase
MSKHSICEIGYHIVFCVKYRKNLIQGEIEKQLKLSISQICEDFLWKIEAIETMPDHIHIFVKTNHLIAPVKIAKILKAKTTKEIFKKFPNIKIKNFWKSGFWSRGCYYSTVGKISEESVKKYIENQKK